MVGGSKTDGKGLKSISNELASAINDGLYFYEQVEMPIASFTFITSIKLLCLHIYFFLEFCNHTIFECSHLCRSLKLRDLVGERIT